MTEHMPRIGRRRRGLEWEEGMAVSAAELGGCRIAGVGKRAGSRPPPPRKRRREGVRACARARVRACAEAWGREKGEGREEDEKP